MVRLLRELDYSRGSPAFTMLQLGGAGMPRRYATYVPQFTEMHRMTSIAAFVVAIGAVLLVAAFVAGRRVDAS